jgi:formate dehydrogenase subunit delta
MMSNDERLAYMLNQIARNFEALGHDAAAAATADHVKSFWAPRMRSRIQDLAQAGSVTLGATSLAALGVLAHQMPEPQTRATAFASGTEPGRSDAG